MKRFRELDTVIDMPMNEVKCIKGRKSEKEK